jgi:predicted DNA-binding protein with PD1-like motif
MNMTRVQNYLQAALVTVIGALASFRMASYALTSAAATSGQRHVAEAIALVGCVGTWTLYQKLPKL